MRLLILLLLPFSAISQSIIYQENCDGATLFARVGDYYAKRQTATAYAITQSKDKCYSATKSARFELRDTDPEVQSGTRAEITFPTTTNNNRWYSYALYAPSADYRYDTNDDVITQWHQGGGLTPALCLRVKSDRLFLRILGKIWIDLGAFDKDSWHTYVMHVKHSSGSDGLIEIWKDGVRILYRIGANMYKVTGDIKNPNLKLGIYKSGWNGTRTTQSKKRVLFFDEIKVGNEKATYKEMAPKR